MFLPSSTFAVVLSATPLATPEEDAHYIAEMEDDDVDALAPPLSAAAQSVLLSVLPTLPASPHVYLAVQRPSTAGLCCADRNLDAFVRWIAKHTEVELHPLPRAHLSVVAEAARGVLYSPSMGHIRTARYPSTSALLFACVASKGEGDAY